MGMEGMGKLRATGEYFITHTSIRGLPKIATSKERFLKFSWTIITTVSFIALFFFIGKLISEYLQYATTTKVREIIAAGKDFPAVTVCYDMPLFKDFEEGKEPIPFANHINDFMVKHYYPHFRNGSSQLKAKDILNLNSIETFLKSNYKSILSRYNSVPPIGEIINCTYVISGKVKPCQIVKYPDEKTGFHIQMKFFHCFTMTIPEEEEITRAIMNIIIKFAVNEKLWMQKNGWFKADLETHTFGYGETVTVRLHDRKDPPWMNNYGTKLMLNQLVQLTYRKVNKHAISVPNYPCNGDPEYSEKKCDDVIKWDNMVKRCGCRIFPMDNSWIKKHLHSEDKDEGIIFCDDLHEVWSNLTKLAKMKECKTKSHAYFWKRRRKFCPRACKTEEYQFGETFTMPWTYKKAKRLQARIDQTTLVQEYFNSSMKGKTHDERLHILTQLVKCVDKTQGHCEIIGEVKHSEHVKSMMLNVRRIPSCTDLEKTESLVITRSSFLSQLGGMCSLFVGLTLTVLADLVETIYKNCIKKPTRTGTERPESLQHYETRAIYTI